MVICLERGADLHMAHLLPLPLTVSYTHLTALFPGLPRWAGTRKVKPIWILLKQETVSLQCFDAVGWAAGRASGL